MRKDEESESHHSRHAARASSLFLYYYTFLSNAALAERNDSDALVPDHTGSDEKIDNTIMAETPSTRVMKILGTEFS